MRAFGAWADDIAAGDASAWQPRAFNASAEAMRDTGTFLPLAVPSAGGVVAETPAEPLPTVAEDLSETLPEIDLPAETPEVQAAPLLPRPSRPSRPPRPSNPRRHPCRSMSST